METLLTFPAGYAFSYEKGEHLFFFEKAQTLQRGKVLFLAGASGSGKSTLLGLIQKLIPSVYLFQNPYSQLVAARVKEEFVFSMENDRKTAAFIEEKLDYWPSRLHFKPLLDQSTFRCSGGECQRVVLASLLASEPAVVLLDEPTAFLDREGAETFYQELALYKQRNPAVTIVIVEHHHGYFRDFIDVVWHINGGLVESMGIDAYLRLAHERALPSRRGDERGEVICVMGKNGAGKTTLLKKIAVAAPKHCAYVPQNPESHFFSDTVRGELRLSDHSLTDEGMRELLTEFSIPLESLERSPLLLSEGEKRRLSVLLGCLLQRPLILYDEPSFGQDAWNLQKIAEQILLVKQRDTVQVVVTHDLEFAEAIGDRILNLDDPNCNWIASSDALLAMTNPSREPTVIARSASDEAIQLLGTERIPRHPLRGHHALFHLLLSCLAVGPFLLANPQTEKGPFLPMWTCVAFVYLAWNGLRLRSFLSIASTALFLNLPMLLSPLLFPSMKAIGTTTILHNYLRLTVFSTLSVASAQGFNYSQFLYFLMSRRWMSAIFGHTLLLSLNSLAQLKAEWSSIQLIAANRGLKRRHYLSLFFPLMVFTIRTAQRGALSLQSRGIRNDKSFFYDYGLSKQDIGVFVLFLAAFALVALSS